MLVEGARGQHAAGGLAVPSRCGQVRDGAFEQMSSLGEYLPVRVGLAFRIAPCGELWAKESFVVALRYVRVEFAYKMPPNHYTAQKIRCAA